MDGYLEGGHGTVYTCEWVSVATRALAFPSPSFSVLTNKTIPKIRQKRKANMNSLSAGSLGKEGMLEEVRLNVKHAFVVGLGAHETNIPRSSPMPASQIPRIRQNIEIP